MEEQFLNCYAKGISRFMTEFFKQYAMVVTGFKMSKKQCGILQQAFENALLWDLSEGITRFATVESKFDIKWEWFENAFNQAQIPTAFLPKQILFGFNNPELYCCSVFVMEQEQDVDMGYACFDDEGNISYINPMPNMEQVDDMTNLAYKVYQATHQNENTFQC